jgi:hypothetical protein
VNTVKCDGYGCSSVSIAYIDTKGFAYCAACGPNLNRQCRRLRPYEQRLLQAGKAIHYAVKPASFYREG